MKGLDDSRSWRAKTSSYHRPLLYRLRVRVIKVMLFYVGMAAWSCLQLGVCDAPCTNLHLSPYESKIGGYPVSYNALLPVFCIHLISSLL